MRATFAAVVFLLLAGCGGPDEFWIYTSLYPHVVERMEPALAAEFPDVEIRFFQMGSEQIAVRLVPELEQGASKCDLLLTSDPFFYAELAEAGHLLAYESPAASRVPAHLRDPGHAFVTVRLPVMVMGVNTQVIGPEARPTAFADLGGERFQGRVSMPDPGKSGTAFTTVASLVRRHGWPFLEAWGANGLVAAGGNSKVIGRLERKEYPVGVVLLENLLPRIRDGSPLAVIYPEDGAVLVPSPIAILQTTRHPELAKRVYDFMFSEAMQDAIVAGHMYSPLPDHAPPEGAPPYDQLKIQPWDHDFVLWVKGRRAEILRGFRAMMRR